MSNQADDRPEERNGVESPDTDGTRENGEPAGNGEVPPAEPEPGPEPRSVEGELRAQVEKLTARLDAALRQLADKDNQVKRLRRDHPRELEAREEAVLRRLLDIVDNFDRAVQSVSESTDLQRHIEGTLAIHHQMKAFLEGYQVRSVDSKGRPFDPNLHEAVGQAPSRDLPEGHVLDVMQPGYLYRDRVLRHARVIVSIRPPEAHPESAPEEGENDDPTRSAAPASPRLDPGGPAGAHEIH